MLLAAVFKINFDVERLVEYDSYMHLDELEGDKRAWTGSPIKQFVPDYYFWVEKADPHPLVNFQGAFGPVRARRSWLTS